MARESLKIGEYEVYTLDDGIFTTGAGELLGDDSLRAKIRGALRPVLVVTGEAIVLIDSGFGPEVPEELQESYDLRRRDGDLMDDLRELDYEPGDVTHLILSHLDPDHAGWAFESRNFPNATVYIQQAALDEARGFREGHPRQAVAAAASRAVEEGWCAVLDGDSEITPGVRTEVRSGHAAGHQMVWIEYGNEAALFTGDLAPSKIFLNPDTIAGVDTDPEAARRNRIEVLTEAVERGAPVILYHEPNDSLVQLRRTEKGFEAIPYGS